MATFNLGDNCVIEETASGDPVIRHTPSGATFTYDSAAGTWAVDDVDATALDINGADVLATGQFTPLLTVNNIALRSRDFTSTSYQSSGSYSSHPISTDWFPSTSITAAIAISVLPGTDETVDVRLFNVEDNDEILATSTASAGRVVASSPYTFSTTGTKRIRVEYRTDPGVNQSSVSNFTVALGVQP